MGRNVTSKIMREVIQIDEARILNHLGGLVESVDKCLPGAH